MVGTDLLVLYSNTSADCSRDWSRAVGDLSALGDLARARNVRIGYEPLCYAPWIADDRMTWDLARQAGHDHVGIVLVSPHVFLPDLPPESIGDNPGEKIFHVEFADRPAAPIMLGEGNAEGAIEADQAIQTLRIFDRDGPNLRDEGEVDVSRWSG